MNLEWLAAALSPRDIAPHPNFMDRDTVRAPNLFALITSIRLIDYGRLVNPPTSSNEERELPQISEADQILLDSSMQALNSNTTMLGVQALTEELMSERERDPACLTAVGLFCSVMACENDNYDSALLLLDHLLRSVRRDDAFPEATKLLVAALLQQKALRLYEIGQDGEQYSSEASRLIDELDFAEIPSFELSESTSWTSAETVASIADALQASAQSHLSTIRGWLDDTWQDVVRRRTGHILLKQESRAASGYRDYLDEIFSTTVGATGVRFTTKDFGDSELYSSLMFAELSGDSAVRRRRADLGVLRFLKSQDANAGSWLRRDSLRLLRQSRDTKRLVSALQFTKSGGPLAAIRDEAQHIVDQRSGPGHIGGPELATLSAGAPLLSEPVASRALDAVLDRPLDERLRYVSRWQARSQHIEESWKAIAALAPSAGRVSEVAARAISLVQNEDTPDELIDRAYAIALNQLDWSEVSESVRAQWINWLSSPKSEQLPILAEIVTPYLNLRYIKNSGSPHPESDVPLDASLENVAANLNDSIVYSQSFPASLALPASNTVKARMSKIRLDAKSGSYSGGVFAAADIAVGLAFHANVDDLWFDIVDFLADPAVSRRDKDEALERIAKSPDRVPISARQLLSARAQVLLRSETTFFSPGPYPYPPALRCLAALQLMNDEALLAQCLELVGAPESLSRTEAARTLTILARRAIPPNWTLLFALQLSVDSDSGTRGEAGRCLALLTQKSNVSEALAEERVVTLLREDGLVMPTLILRALQESRHLTGAILQEVREMAISHEARTVRILAGALLHQD